METTRRRPSASQWRTASAHATESEIMSATPRQLSEPVWRALATDDQNTCPEPQSFAHKASWLGGQLVSASPTTGKAERTERR